MIMETQSFVIMLRPAPKYGEEGTAEKVSEHFKYLQNLHKQGIVKIAGRFSDVLIGLVMLEVKSHEEALEIMRNDPAIRSGIFHGELYPWSIALQ